jgi:DNA-directed RNA polymerase specialized sigma24 family protein
VSKQNPENDKTGIPESAPATNLGPIRCGGGDSVKDHVNGDGQIVDRCLAGDKQAWEGLYRECHPRLRKAIQLLLGAEAADVHIIDEIAARVWYALLRDDGRLLGTYDADRESTLDSFLMGLARIEILRYTRAERRRHQHEMLSGRRRLEEQRVSEWQLATMMDEFVSTLTPGQREFMDRFLTAPAEDEPDPALKELSGICVRVRRHRIRRKLNDFLEDL